MNSKRLPYIFIVVLLIIAAMLIGIRIGKNVEESNKTISFILSITPTKLPTSFPTFTISYRTYEHKGCGIDFTIPSFIKLEKESSQTASLKSDTDTSIVISCEKTPGLLNDLQNQKVATREIELNNQKLKATEFSANKVKLTQFTVRNPRNGKNITIRLDNSLLQLFAQTLHFNL